MILRKERKGCSVKYTCERMDKLRNLQRKYQRDVSVLLYERDAKLQETQCDPHPKDSWDHWDKSFIPLAEYQ